MTTDNQGIYDARELGKPKFVVLGIQHLFAMFGATILVPLITGLDVSATSSFSALTPLRPIATLALASRRLLYRCKPSNTTSDACKP